MYGWMGKILNINLTTSEISLRDTKQYVEKYLGGRGIASRIYWQHVKPETAAFDPENHLIFVTGPLVATGAQGAMRVSIMPRRARGAHRCACAGMRCAWSPVPASST